MRRLALLLLVIPTVSCTGRPAVPEQDGGPPTDSPPEMAQPSAEDLQEIEQVLRDYFEALRTDDWAERKRLSIGELRALGDWQQILVESSGRGEAELETETMEVTSVTETSATVDFEATLTQTFVNPLTGGTDTSHVDFSGPVILERSGEAWRVADYVRNGRSLQEELFTRVDGRQEKNGIILEVVGADLRDNGTLVAVQLTNNTQSELTMSTPILVTENGQQLGDGFTTVTSLAPQAQSLEVLSWTRDLPLTTRSFRVVVMLFGDDFASTTDFDLMARLRD
jgi:hypothetical protein